MMVAIVLMVDYVIDLVVLMRTKVADCGHKVILQVLLIKI